MVVCRIFFPIYDIFINKVGYMKKGILILFSIFILSCIMGFSKHVRDIGSKKYIILVLHNPMNEECFSSFDVVESGGVLIGVNRESGDYRVEGGLYRIEGSSNDIFYHKKIMIIAK